MIDLDKKLINIDGGEIEQIKVAESIFLYTNALSEKLCDEIYDFYFTNRELASKGITVGGQHVDIKNTFDIKSTSDIPLGPLRDKYLELDERVYKSLKVISEAYIEHFDWLKNAPNLVDTGYLWQMYEANEGFYKEHIDGENWTSGVDKRLLAFVVYLNTVEEGGETYFRYQNVSVKPVKGSVAIFPTSWTHPHQAMMPISNHKLIISSFIIWS
jgi:hypothetical protein